MRHVFQLTRNALSGTHTIYNTINDAFANVTVKYVQRHVKPNEVKILISTYKTYSFVAIPTTSQMVY